MRHHYNLEGLLTKVPVKYRGYIKESFRLGQISFLQEDLEKSVPEPIDINIIMEVIYRETGISLYKIRGGDRSYDVVIARKIACVILFSRLKNYSKVGELMNKDRNTVKFHVDNFPYLLKSDKKIKEIWGIIKNSLK